MPAYPTAESEAQVPPEKLAREVRAIFERCGMTPDDAGLLADSLVSADVR